MKKKLIRRVVFLTIAITVALNICVTARDNSMVELSFANIEELATDSVTPPVDTMATTDPDGETTTPEEDSTDDEETTDPDGGSGGSTSPTEDKTWQVGEKTITETSEPGWSWSVEMNLWLFKGNVTHSSPPTVTVLKINCCREQGPESSCSYETC